MIVKLLLFASYRQIVGRRELEIELADGTTMANLLAQLASQHPDLSGVAGVSRCVVNHEYVAADTVLQAGDEVAFLPPVSGGGDRFEVTDDPLDADLLISEVTDETVGAVAVFVGVARRLSRGKRVSYLEYEAYRPMAEKKLAEIGADIRRRWPVESVAIRHRVGRLEIGETAIVIAVGSPHRGEAFEACRYAIDQIKHRVPIWKKESWEDGEVWVGIEGG